MKIRIVQIGKNKDKYIQEGVDEFLKRLKGFANVEIVTLKELTASKTFPKERVREEEGEEILKAIDARFREHDKRGNDIIISLDEKGKDLSSIEFSNMLQKFKNSGENLTFVIGGPYGLSDEVRKNSNTILSFSRLTFTHQMIRLLLLEQIYRGFCIMTGKEYHNE
jgi:23S rRNA (pseudouridine1915-N3)-methyltransferase